MKSTKITLAVLVVIMFNQIAVAQEEQEDDNFIDYKVNLLFGLNQPLLDGFNIEGNLFYERWVFDYSHGVSLNFDNEILDDENQGYGIDVHVPWTTGFGVGYRFNDWLNLRAEPKWHKFELYQMNEVQTPENLITSYTTFTMGVGLYANFQPFKHKNNFLRGIMIAPSVRYWPQVSSSLENDEVTFYSKSLGREVTHNAMEVGAANTPWIFNISIGYSIDWERASK